jgi:hypothetical protein
MAYERGEHWYKSRRGGGTVTEHSISVRCVYRGKLGHLGKQRVRCRIVTVGRVLKFSLESAAHSGHDW